MANLLCYLAFALATSNGVNPFAVAWLSHDGDIVGITRSFRESNKMAQTQQKNTLPTGCFCVRPLKLLFLLILLNVRCLALALPTFNCHQKR